MENTDPTDQITSHNKYNRRVLPAVINADVPQLDHGMSMTPDWQLNLICREDPIEGQQPYTHVILEHSIVYLKQINLT